MCDLVGGLEGVWCDWSMRREGGSQGDKATGAGGFGARGFPAGHWGTTGGL